jgi:hypothetical protein
MTDMPDTDPVAAGRRRDGDIDALVAALNGPNPHASDMALPPALTDDGGSGS